MSLVLFSSKDEYAVTSFLLKISEAIAKKNNSTSDTSTFRYGELWNSDIFLMKPYCWCESRNCPWCSSVEEMELIQENTDIINKNLNLFPNIPKNKDDFVPNFWHKPSGFHVSWYKYIPRSIEIHGEVDLSVIGKECLEDILNSKGTFPDLYIS